MREFMDEQLEKVTGGGFLDFLLDASKVVIRIVAPSTAKNINKEIDDAKKRFC